MEDQITDYLGKESEGASEDLLRNQKITNKRYGTHWKFLLNKSCVYEMKVWEKYAGRMPSLWLQIQSHNFCRML